MSRTPRGTMMKVLVDLHKAVTTSTITEIVPEDLEQDAHNTLWKETSSRELTLLKLLPSIDANAVEHEYDKIISYGESRGNGFFGEETLPMETEPDFDRVTTPVRLLGEMSQTFLLASLEKTIRVEGETGAENIAKSLLMKNLLRKKNRAMYFADTRTVRSGTTALRFKGLLQQIEEGTDGTTGTSPYGSHVIDMEGQPFTVANIRSRAAQVLTQFGDMNSLIMDPFTRADLESDLDGSVRSHLPIDARAIMLGHNVGGMHTQGSDIFFHTDNTLTPLHRGGKYINAAMPGAPSAPTVATPTAGTGGSGLASKFLVGDAASHFWMVTEVKNERESIGVRAPSSGHVAVAVGQEVTFSVDPNDPNSDSFKVYRGAENAANTDAWFIFEVSNSGGGAAVTFYDRNAYRPMTGCAFGLALSSGSQQALHSAPSGQRSSYALAREESANFLRQEDSPQNTVTLVELGPSMGVMELATILATSARPLIYTACGMQVRNPLQNVAFINIGSSTNPLLS